MNWTADFADPYTYLSMLLSDSTYNCSGIDVYKRQMEEILSGLLKAGMDENTPAAVLEKGTTAGQRIVTAALGSLKEKADREKIGTPSIVLVGAVCRLSKQLHWAGDRILGGRQFLITSCLLYTSRCV